MSDSAKIAYLMNTYPMPSTTFIRREADALERHGFTISRHAVRHWKGDLIDPLDIAELKRTRYLLTDNFVSLFIAFVQELLTNPSGFVSAFGVWLRLLHNARGGFIKHAAYLLQAAHFRQRVAAEGVEHVHVHFATNSAAVAMLAQALGGPAFSFTVHGPDEFLDPDGFSFALKIHHAAFVVAISEHCRQKLVGMAEERDREKIAIVHCGLAFDDFAPADAHDNQTFVCVGRLCPQKGQVLIPAAVAALRREFPRLRVALVGDGESRAAVEAAIAEHGVADMVELLGWRSNRDVRQLITESRALLLPSFAEGLPVVIMEAMALQRPVVSTTVAGIPELVLQGEHGWLVPPGDVAALVGAMRACLGLPVDALARMGAAARARVLARHDVVIEAAKLGALFKRTLPARTEARRLRRAGHGASGNDDRRSVAHCGLRAEQD